jgi:hypothetical protein
MVFATYHLFTKYSEIVEKLPLNTDLIEDKAMTYTFRAAAVAS